MNHLSVSFFERALFAGSAPIGLKRREKREKITWRQHMREDIERGYTQRMKKTEKEHNVWIE